MTRDNESSRSGIGQEAETKFVFSSWNYSRGKRIVDLLAATIILLLSSPLLLLTAVLVKISSRGPVFFRHNRVSMGGREFALLKFRTMLHDAQLCELHLTARGDTRITRVGRFLRKWKLDELPQLINVIRGEMSLVGPRPDRADFLAALSAKEKSILDLRPGITGSATLHFRNEEILLANVPVAEQRKFYVTTLLPEKVRLDMSYAKRATLLSDLLIMACTARAVLFGATSSHAVSDRRILNAQL